MRLSLLLTFALCSAYRRLPRASTRLLCARTQVPAELASRLQEYLEVWRGEGRNASRAAKKDPEDLLMGALRPSGWFKDEAAEAFARRADSAAPFDPHPFAHVNLKRLGYADVTEEIMGLGGPLAVGDQLGLDWTPQQEFFDPSYTIIFTKPTLSM
ncbi:hypothetical protein B484DRAFT_445175 [Ochromonadaceae sp. CCMP2298]|nr:hypothetical protein B484DRAFT_445175 [Ochromonadaceae sp. CCMP2298]